MVIDTILFEDTVGETRAALLGGGAVVEVRHRRPTDRVLPGAIFRGRVRKVDKGLNAAFVDIGEERDAFLRARDAGRAAGAPRIERLIAEGAMVSVAVAASPAAGKGARVAAVDEGHGDAVGLFRPAPGLVAEVLDDFSDDGLQTIGTDGAPAARAVREWLARHSGFGGEVSHAAEPASLFAAHGVEAALATAVQRRVALPGGGSVTFDRTAALHVVDIDTDGRAGVAGRGELDVNLAAMAVIGRQLRLRRLGGAMVIDAVRMTRDDDRDAVVQGLRDAVADDPVATKVFGVSALGLVELSRQRQGLSLAEYLCGPGCEGAGPTAETAAFMGLRAVQRSVRTQLGARWRLQCADAVAAMLTGPLAAEFAAVTAGLGVDLQVEADPKRGMETCELVPA